MGIYFVPFFRLTFNEANILMENISGKDKTNLLIHLEKLSENTTDEILRRSAISLLKKIALLSEEEYARLIADASKGLVLYPPNYLLNK